MMYLKKIESEIVILYLFISLFENSAQPVFIFSSRCKFLRCYFFNSTLYLGRFFAHPDLGLFMFLVQESVLANALLVQHVIAL